MKSNFRQNICVTQLGTSRNWRLEKNLEFHYKDKWLIVKKGFITDGRSFGTAVDTYFRAYVIHDALYRSGLVPRKEADIAMDIALEVLGAGWWRRHSEYMALRMFGSATKDIDLITNAKKYVEVYELGLAELVSNGEKLIC